jgi:4-amino-4-deoxy-L-arabinose transferase-like glycosyltransferase
VYFFAAKYKWGQKLLHLAAATVLLLVVSFSWAVAVDLTPPENRPYVGGSEDNTVMELIFGHNGISRIIGGGLNRIRYDAPRQLLPGQKPPAGAYPPVVPGGQAQPGPYPLPPIPGPGGQGPGDQDPARSGSGNVMDVGTPGTLRLFTFPLAGEIGWTLPFVLGGLVIILIVFWKQPSEAKHAALILWASWLIPESLYFTYSTGIMHAYYMIMMGAPLAALFAMTGWAFQQLLQKRKSIALGLVALLSAGTLFFQAGLLREQTFAAPWAVGGAVLLLGVGITILALSHAKSRRISIGLSLLMIALLVAPGLWSALTTFNSTPNTALPYSGPAQGGDVQPGMIPEQGNQQPRDGTGVNPRLLAYLLENRDGEKYLLATVNANQAAPFILATGLPVFTFGGFGGMDVIVDSQGLAEMVAAGELRFVLNQGLEERQEILGWLQQNCTPVNLPGLTPGQAGQQVKQANLLDCGK